MEQKKIDTGGFIYHEGDVPDFAYIIDSGRVEIIEIKGGQESQIRTVETGQTFGEFALFDPQTFRPYAARALEPCVLTAVSLEDFKTLLPKCPREILPFLMLCFDRMKATRVKEKATVSTILQNDVKKITLSPESDKLKAQFKPMDVALDRLPFRIGGYPEGGEISRRDQLHLYISSQNNPLRVSRQQCEIVIQNGGLWVMDLGSRFNTVVNGLIIGRGHGVYEAPLKKGINEILLGGLDSPYKISLNCE